MDVIYVYILFLESIHPKYVLAHQHTHVMDMSNRLKRQRDMSYCDDSEYDPSNGANGPFMKRKRESKYDSDIYTAGLGGCNMPTHSDDDAVYLNVGVIASKRI